MSKSKNQFISEETVVVRKLKPDVIRLYKIEASICGPSRPAVAVSFPDGRIVILHAALSLVDVYTLRDWLAAHLGIEVGE